MAGYWPSSFFCVFMDEKERGQDPAILTEQTWSIKDLLYGFPGNFSCGTRRVVLSGQDSSILPARLANHSAGFDSCCPLTELANIIKALLNKNAFKGGRLLERGRSIESLRYYV